MRISSREYVIKKMQELMILPKKKYSQNFLTDTVTVQKAIDYLDLNSCEECIEIGPGLGALTQEIILRNHSLTCYEIDQDMVNHLHNEFKKNDNLMIIEKDFMKADLSKYLGKEVKIISNLPYNLTTPIIEKTITSHIDLKTFEFMVQKEVANRLMSKIGTKDYGPLVIFLNYLGKLEIVEKVTRDKFIPSPNVDSVILGIKINKTRDYDFEEKLYRLLNSAFLMRRKTILNNLNAFLKDKEKAQMVLEGAKIPFNTRPEQISLEEYILICKQI